MAELEDFLIFTGDMNARLRDLSPEERPLMAVTALHFAELEVVSFEPLQTMRTDRYRGAVLLPEGNYRVDALKAIETNDNPAQAEIFGIIALEGIARASDSHAGLRLSVSQVNSLAQETLGEDSAYIAKET